MPAPALTARTDGTLTPNARPALKSTLPLRECASFVWISSPIAWCVAMRQHAPHVWTDILLPPTASTAIPISTLTLRLEFVPRVLTSSIASIVTLLEPHARNACLGSM
jgi:hypothetical protein